MHGYMILVPFWSPKANHPTPLEREGVRRKRHLLQTDRALSFNEGYDVELVAGVDRGRRQPVQTTR